jgi:hypothetical protein
MAIGKQNTHGILKISCGLFVVRKKRQEEWIARTAFVWNKEKHVSSLVFPRNTTVGLVGGIAHRPGGICPK